MILRSAVPADAEKLLAVYSYYVLRTAVTFEYDVPSPEEFRNRIENTLKKYPYLVLEEGSGIRGYAYAGPFVGRAAYGRSCETTIYLERSAPRKTKNTAGRYRSRIRAVDFCDAPATNLKTTGIEQYK